MMGVRSRRRFGVLAFVGAFVAAPSHAAVDTLVVTYSGGGLDNPLDYIPGSDDTVPAVLIAGQTLQYRNMQAGLPHDLTSSWCVNASASYEDERSGGSCATGFHRLFASAVIGYNIETPVVGTETLPPGEYRFFCTVHGAALPGRQSSMGGSLLVVGP